MFDEPGNLLEAELPILVRIVEGAFDVREDATLHSAGSRNDIDCSSRRDARVERDLRTIIGGKVEAVKEVERVLVIAELVDAGGVVTELEVKDRADAPSKGRGQRSDDVEDLSVIE